MFRCYRQPGNFYSRPAIIVKSRNNKTIGHIPDGLAKVIHGLVVEGKINRIDGKITGEARSAPEGTWSKGGGGGGGGGGGLNYLVIIRYTVILIVNLL